MLVSIVVITYNQSKIVRETLDSIYLQTYSPLELIVSDDCSGDNTISVVQEWVEDHRERFVRVEIVESKINTGVTANCNRGIAAAKGEFLQLIAGDDILMPEAIMEKVNYAEQNNINYVVCKTEPFGDDEERIKGIAKWCEDGYRIIRQGYEAQVDAILQFNFYAGPCGSFFRLKWFREFGGFDERYPMMEDYPFVFRYIISGNEIQLLEKVLSKYRIYTTSLSGSAQSPMWQSNWDFFFRECFPEIIRRKKIGMAFHMIYMYAYYKYLRGTAFDKLVIKRIGRIKKQRKR